MSDIEVGDVVRYAPKRGKLSGTVWLVMYINAHGFVVCSPVFVPSSYEHTRAVHFKACDLEKVGE